MKKSLFFAAALLALVACNKKEESAEIMPMKTDGSIQFVASQNKMTRQDSLRGKDAAKKLNNEFIVYGIKHGVAEDKTSANDEVVFQHYVVKYADNTAMTTTSNTKNWEYVGYTQHATAVTPFLAATQTIKYWDYAAKGGYTFYAFSGKHQDLVDGKIVLAKTTAGTHDKYEKGYELTIKNGVDLDSLYFSDRMHIDYSADSNRVAVNKYGGIVTLTFRNFSTKIRFGFYETIPGYSVNIDKIKYNGAFQTAKFGVDGKFMIPSDDTKYTITYRNAGDTIDQVKTQIQAGSAEKGYYEKAAAAGTIMTATALGTTRPAATMDSLGGKYTTILPYEQNATNMSFTVNYTLTSLDGSGEQIHIYNATAIVPFQYCQWKPNYSYTYIFKLSDQTNGVTDTITNISGLYPITFDAIVINTEDGLQETITEVGAPCITTMGWTAGNVCRVEENEYKATDVIYINVMAPGEITLADTNSKLYTVTTADATNFPITEASVAEALNQEGLSAEKITTADAVLTFGTTIPNENGEGTRNLHVAKFTAAAGTYAYEYNSGNKIAMPQIFASQADMDAYIALGHTLYATPAEAKAGSGTAITTWTVDTYYYVQEDMKYYKIIVVKP